MTSVRITNIDPTTTKEGLIQFFQSKGFHSRVFLTESSDGNTATATFDNEAALKSVLRLPRESKKLEGKDLGLDCRFLGFTNLYEGNNSTIEYAPFHSIPPLNCTMETEEYMQYCRSSRLEWPCIRYVETS